MHPLDYADIAAAAYGDRIAFADAERQYSFREVRLISERIADAMIAGGFQDLDRAAVYSWSDVRAFLCILGIMRAGGVVVPINAAGSPDASIAAMQHTRPAWVFHHPALAPAVDRIRADVPSVRCCTSLDVRAPAFERQADSDASTVPAWADASGSLDRPVTIVHTGGTTGAGKAIVVHATAYGAYLEGYRRFLGYDDAHPVCLGASQF